MSRLRLTDPSPEIEALPRHARIAPPTRVIGIVALGERERTRRAFEDVAPEIAWRRIAVRTRAGTEPLTSEVGGGIAASIDALPGAIASLLEPLADRRIVALEGLAAVGYLKTELSILVHGGRPPTDWPRDVRAMRREFQLITSELRPSLVRALLERLG